MVVILEGGCRVSDMHDGDPTRNGTLRIWKQIGRDTGAQAISLSVWEFGPGLSPLIQNNRGDEILYVLNDLSAAYDDNANGSFKVFVNGCAFEVSSDSGIYIRPGETFGVHNSHPDPITIISSRCPDPGRETEFVTAPATSAPGKNPPIVRLADQRAQSTADRWYRVLVDERVGSEQVTQFVGSIPHGRAPDHFHQYEEVLFILKGEGRMWAGETHTPIGPGSCIYLPQGQIHCVENTGAGELRLVGVFYPAGSPSVRYDA